MFYDKVVEGIIKNRNNNYQDNVDLLRYPDGLEYNFKKELKLKILSIIPERIIWRYRNYSYLKDFLIHPFSYYFNDIENLYFSLEDEDSKNTLIQVVVFLILRHKKVKLPYNNQFYKDKIKELKLLHSRTEKHGFIDISRYGYDLRVDIPIKAIYDTFIYKHYSYKGINAEKNEIVLDLGGWIGDTAMFFSRCVGEQGKVYTFEFMPENLRRFRRNLEQNQIDNVEIVENPVWVNSNEIVYVSGTGSGAKIENEDSENSIKFKTISIDDFVVNMNLKSVDFIKMDIEGAEQMALKGASKTIKKFKPKLAISIYHNYNDFTQMHKLIKDIEGTYKFYLSHCTMYQEETVLFAISK